MKLKKRSTGVMKMKFAKASICKCGFPVLNDDIKIGTVYEVDASRHQCAMMSCGGCGTLITSLDCVWATREGSTFGWLPLKIFEPIEKTIPSAKIVTPEGRVQVVVPKDGKKFTLEEMQKIVGGYIEVVRPPGQMGAVMVCNEDGKLEGLPANSLASQMWCEGAEKGSPRENDGIVGTVLLCHESQID